MADSVKVRHHFVPVFYLEGFREPYDPNLIWVYDKETGKVFSQTPDNVGYEKHYHTVAAADGSKDSNTIEDYLAEVWEGPVAGILKEIVGGSLPSPEKRQFFACFMGLSFTRVPNHRMNLENAFAHVAKHLATFTAKNPAHFANTVQNYEKHMGQKLTDDPEYLRQFILKGEYALETCPEVYLKMFIAHGIELGLVIERMHWIILCATDQFKFLTSDNPLFFTDPRRDAQSPYRGVGLMNATVEVTFPLSRELALFASWNRSHPEGFLQANNNLVKRVNRGTALSAQRFVYASERSDALARMVSKFRGARPIIATS